MRIFKGLRKVSDGFLKKYELSYDADGAPVRWEMISLNELTGGEQLAATQTAVEIIARFEDGDVLLCREFRFTVNDYCWEFPTGIIEPGETPEQAAARELQEETGLRLVRVEQMLPPCCYSVGLTDEIIVPLFVTVAGEMRPCNEAYEEITSFKLPLAEAKALMARTDVKFTETCALALAGMR